MELSRKAKLIYEAYFALEPGSGDIIESVSNIPTTNVISANTIGYQRPELPYCTNPLRIGLRPIRSDSEPKRMKNGVPMKAPVRSRCWRWLRRP